MRKLVPILIVITFLFTGCNSKEESHMPDQMPTDFAFSVSYGVGSKNKIDSFHGMVVKDLIGDGAANAEVTFSNEELISIYQAMKKIKVLNPKELVADTRCSAEPHAEDVWKIRINGIVINIENTTRYCEITEDAKQFFELRNFIFNIVKNKEEYKKLPEVKGAYL
jgi:hypothetical protein